MHSFAVRPVTDAKRIPQRGRRAHSCASSSRSAGASRRPPVRVTCRTSATASDSWKMSSRMRWAPSRIARPDTCRASDHHHGCRRLGCLSSRTRGVAGDKPPQLAQLRPAVHEGAHVGRQLARDGLRARRRLSAAWKCTPPETSRAWTTSPLTWARPISLRTSPVPVFGLSDSVNGRRLTSASGQDGRFAPSSPWGWQAQSAEAAAGAQPPARRSWRSARRDRTGVR
jgi:hypothetical protein